MNEGLDPGILGPAFLAGLLVLTTHVPLGREVIRRGIIFIDIAIAQLAGTGVIAAKVTGFAHDWWQLQLAGLTVALLGAGFLTWSERRWPDLQEAIIGVIFVSMASLAIVVLAGHPHAGDELQSLLAGQILWVTADMLWRSGIGFAIVLLAWLLLPQHWRRQLFYLLFTVAVTTSVQLVGVYLVFASLILPALAVQGMHARAGIFVGLVAGAAGYAVGLVGSALFDLPAGSLCVLGLLGASLLVLAARAVMR